MTFDAQPYLDAIEDLDLIQVVGKVTKVVGLVVEAQVQGVKIGELCRVMIDKTSYIESEVIGFKEDANGIERCVIELQNQTVSIKKENISKKLIR